MTIDSTYFIILVLAFFLVAFLYSSVGFGGGSSYLALLALVLTSFFVIRSTALICNLIVVSGSSFLYFKSGHLELRKCVPFVASSIPMAFIGAMFRLQEYQFFILLGGTLVLTAIALVVQTLRLRGRLKTTRYSNWYSYGIGGGVGLLSGLIGIGGGIFLAPVLNYMKWGKPLQIAALASFFILVNSVSGIVGLVYSGTFEVLWPQMAILAIVVFLGGQLGVRLTLFKISSRLIRLFTALLVFFVGIRVMLFNGFQIELFT